MQQKNIRFGVKGSSVQEHCTFPKDFPLEKLPAIVLGHGTASVKEMHLPRFAQQFVTAGLIIHD